jgi:hypothetical protein
VEDLPKVSLPAGAYLAGACLADAYLNLFDSQVSLFQSFD